MTRAAPLSPAERREALVAATLPLLREHGRAVTTRQIAAAAGVAEGTIFRVFASKDELVEETLRHAFEPGGLLELVAEIDPSAPLRERMVELAALMQRRFQDVFGLMRAVGLVTPPHQDHEKHREIVEKSFAAMADVLRPDANALRLPPEQLVHVLRMLTFAGSHEEISHGNLLSPEEIVDIVLDGVRKTHSPGRGAN